MPSAPHTDADETALDFPEVLFDRLRSLGWLHVRETAARHHLQSPDGWVYAAQNLDAPQAAFEVAVSGTTSTPGWHQVFAATTPFPLVTAFVLGLLSTAPRPRHVDPLPPVDGMPWLLGPGSPEDVLDALTSKGWSAVADRAANVHCGSPDGRAYVGFLPERWMEGPGYSWRDEWEVRVDSGSPEGPWTQCFHVDTPEELVAVFVSALADRLSAP